MTKALWKGETLAESDKTTVVEGNHYFPRESLKDNFFEPSQKTTVCSWKGVAEYLTVKVGADKNVDAAWFYNSPKDAAKEISGMVAFWKGVEII